MARVKIDAFAALAALAILAAGSNPASAATVCIGANDPHCPKLTNDPQPNVGDAAPGMIDRASGGAAPAAAAAPPPPAPVLRAKPLLPPPPADAEEKLEPDPSQTDGQQ